MSTIFILKLGFYLNKQIRYQHISKNVYRNKTKRNGL